MAEIVRIDRDRREIWLDSRPSSKREVMSLLLQYWRDEEVDFAIMEVMDFPKRVFWDVHWQEAQLEMEGLDET
jgi:hypothetical protein